MSLARGERFGAFVVRSWYALDCGLPLVYVLYDNMIKTSACLANTQQTF